MESLLPFTTVFSKIYDAGTACLLDYLCYCSYGSRDNINVQKHNGFFPKTIRDLCLVLGYSRDFIIDRLEILKKANLLEEDDKSLNYKTFRLNHEAIDSLYIREAKLLSEAIEGIAEKKRKLKERSCVSIDDFNSLKEDIREHNFNEEYLSSEEFSNKVIFNSDSTSLFIFLLALTDKLYPNIDLSLGDFNTIDTFFRTKKYHRKFGEEEAEQLNEAVHSIDLVSGKERAHYGTKVLLRLKGVVTK